MKHRIYNWLCNNKKSTLLIAAVLILFVAPIFAHAGFAAWVGFTGENLFYVIGVLGTFVVSIMGYLLNKVQAIFELILNENINFTSHLEVIKVGWKLSRDVVNMLFVVVVFAIAITTILRLQGSFLTKDTLFRLVMMAILVNFSLVIGGLVIDASNALGIQFYNAIRGNDGKISSVIMGHTGLQNAFKVETTDTPTPTPASTNMHWAILAWSNAILISMLVFIFVVATMLFFVRFVALMFLLMLAPLAFVSHILPSTEQHWSKWWKELTNHAFFFPAFMFLLYFALAFSGNIQKAAQATGPGGNLIENDSLLLAYGFTIAVLMASLTLGKSMGVYGADTAMAWARQGRKMAIGAVGWTAGKAVGAGIQRSGVLENERVKNLQDRLTQGGFVSRFAARTLDATKNRLNAVGGYQKGGERDADFLPKSAKSNWKGGYSKLTSAGKAAFLNKLSDKDRADFVGNLSDSEKTYAERIVRGRLAPTADAALQAAKIQRTSSRDEQLRLYASSSEDAKEQYLRSLDQNGRAQLENDLNKSNDPSLQKAGAGVKTLMATHFSSIDRTAHEVAQFDLLTDDEKVAKFGLHENGRPLLDERTAAMILKGKSKGERKKLFDKIRATPDTDERKFGNKAADFARNALKNYSTTEEWREQEVDEFLALPLEQQKASLSRMLTDVPGESAADRVLKRRSAEDIIKKMGSKDQAQLMHLVGDTPEGKKMDAFMRTSLSGRDYAKYIGERSELWSNTEVNARFGTFDDLSKEEILRKYKVGPELASFVGQLSTDDAKAAEKVIEATFATGEKAKYHSAKNLNLLPFDRVLDAFVAEDTSDLVREQMLRDMTAERRAGFLQDLSKRSPADYAIAERALKRFSQEDQDNYTFERFKFEGDKDRRVALLAGANDRVRAKILAGGFNDEKARESFLNTKLAEYDKLDATGKATYLKQHLPGFPADGTVADTMTGLQEKSRTILTSSAFTDAQRKAYLKNQLLAQIDGWQFDRVLGREFYGDSMTVQKRSDLLRNADTEGRRDIFNAAAADTTGTSMEKLHLAISGLDRTEQEEFLRSAIPATNPGTMHSYLLSLEEKAKSAERPGGDAAAATRLRQLQRLTFQYASPDQQVASWEEAFKQYQSSGTSEATRSKSSLEMHRDVVDDFVKQMGPNSAAVGNYHSSFVKQLQNNPNMTPEVIASMYPQMDSSVRAAFIKSTNRGIVDTVKSVYDAAPENVRSQIRNDIKTSGTGDRYKDLESHATATVPTQSVAQVQNTLLQQQASVVQAGFTKAGTGGGSPPGGGPSGGGGTPTATPHAAPATTPQAAPARPAPTVAPHTAPATTTHTAPTAQPAAHAGGGGSAKPNAGAVAQAKQAPSGGGAPVLSKAASSFTSQTPQKAAESYRAHSSAQKQEVMTHSPETMVKLRDHAKDPATQMQIANDLQTSAPATRFRDAGGSSGKTAALQSMSNEEKRIVLEAAASANDPRELKSLRAAIESLPAEEQKAFHENVTQQASSASVGAYAHQVQEEKVSAQKTNLAGKVESLTKEETLIKNITTSRVAAATPTTTAAPRVDTAPTRPPSNTPVTTTQPIGPATTAPKSTVGQVLRGVGSAPDSSPRIAGTAGKDNVPSSGGPVATTHPTAPSAEAKANVRATIADALQAPEVVMERDAAAPQVPAQQRAAPSVPQATLGNKTTASPNPLETQPPEQKNTPTTTTTPSSTTTAPPTKETPLDIKEGGTTAPQQTAPAPAPVEQNTTTASVEKGTASTAETEAGVSIQFRTNPSEIQRGQSSTIEWVVGKAKTVMIDNGIGSQGRSGRIAVSPSTTTRYTLTAVGENGETKKSSVTIVVKAVPVPTTTKPENKDETPDEDKKVISNEVAPQTSPDTVPIPPPPTPPPPPKPQQ
jgi:hypothetical protein